MSDDISLEAAEILEGLNESLMDAKGEPVTGIKKSVVYRVQPKEIREHLHMSQKDFSKAYGIPLATLQNWEQGRRKIDATAASYLKAILRFPKEIMSAHQMV